VSRRAQCQAPNPLWLVLVIACGPPAQQPAFGPIAQVLSLDRPANPSIGLVRILHLRTTTPCEVELQVDGGPRVRVPGHRTDHELPLYGLRPDAEQRVQLTLIDEAGARWPGPARLFRTDPLPPRFPQLEVLVHDRAAMEPGYTLFDIKSPTGDAYFLVALDRNLEVVWYHLPPRSVGDVRRTPDGHLWGLAGVGAFERDLMGVEHRAYGSDEGLIPLPVPALHHEIFVLPNQRGFLSLNSGIGAVGGYPYSYDTPHVLGPADIIDHRAVHIGLDGELIRTVQFSDILDPSRIGFDSLNGSASGYDWAHANGVVEDESGRWILSARHQDALVAVRPDNGIDWILGHHGGWADRHRALLLEPVGEPFSWPFHAHAPEWSDGTLILFDNGNWRASPYDPPSTARHAPYSRVVAYAIDEEARTVRELWSFRDTVTGSLFSPALGDADRMPHTGHILATFGFLDGEALVPNADHGLGRKSVRLIEFDPATGSTLMDVRLFGWLDEEPEGFKTYRAERVPSLYPDDHLITFP
jgi:arylsulfate sulfotransferase